MSNHKNLVWFNKEGDYLNFKYNEGLERFEGNIIFHENSSDTFKTYGLYMMEKLPSFEYELPGELTIAKFQLFNEFGLHLYGSKYQNEPISLIEPINNDYNFYSKWIYGENFEKKFPVGTIIKFDTPFLEFTDINKTYAVVSSKKGAIMIISQMDNDTFETTYYDDYSENLGIDQTLGATPSIYTGKTITGLNAIGVYDYIDSQYQTTLSPWSEPFFYDKYYLNRKLNLINTEKQEEEDVRNGTGYRPKIVTINNIDLTDQAHFEYSVNRTSLPQDSNLIIEVLTRMDLPKIYEGGLDISSDGKISLTEFELFPQTVRPGKEIKIINSVDNTNFLTVANIPDWAGIVNETFFATQSQVIFENRIYECVQSYTQSFGDGIERYIDPTNTDYWSNPTYIPVEQSTISESILFGQIYYTTDKYYFEMAYTQSANVTMASAVEKYKEDLKIFNIDIFYQNNQLRADLMYPSKYAIVNFYHTSIGPTYSIGNQKQTVEKLVGVSEQLNYELNYNFSEQFKYNIVFTDLDQYGLKISINGMIYEEEISFIYSGASIDMERTIDSTLRKWLIRNYIDLYILGIRAELRYIGNYTSIFYNSIVIETEYPNVPMKVDYVRVGDTANFYIEHSRVIFNSGSYSIPFINVNINGEEYRTDSVYYPSTNVTDIPTTLQNWVDEHSPFLLEMGYVVTNINYVLKLDVNQLDIPLNFTISTGRVNLPGLQDYTIQSKIRGNHGMLITSNEVLLPPGSSASFEAEGFATGRVISINNTIYPWNNQEYNVQFLDPQIMNLSYQGPFWGLTDSICNSSAFVSLAFDTGFGQTACEPIGPTGPTGGGPFFTLSFTSSAFSISFNPNTYEITELDLTGEATGLVDLEYIQVSNSLYAFGDNVNVIDSVLGFYYQTINLPGNTQSIEMEFNTINNYLYCLSAEQMWVIDPTSNTLLSNISLTASYPGSIAFDLQVNYFNGDVYVSYENSPRIDIWAFDNISTTPTDVLNSSDTYFPALASRTGKMIFNSFENDIYVTTDVDQVLRINSDRTIQETYGITGLTHSLFYEPVFESVYVYSTTSLWQIDNGLTQSIALSPGSFNDIIFNNITGEMNISDSSGNFTRLDLSNDSYIQNPIVNYGYLQVNQYDGDTYLSSIGPSQSSIVVVNALTSTVMVSHPMSAQTTKLVYNPDRKSIWAIQPSIDSLVEVKVELFSTLNILSSGSSSVIEDGQYGTLDPNYETRESVWLKAREYIRRPRENYEGDVSVQYYYKWLTDDVPQFFMYDYSGDQISTGPYAYTGPKPLPVTILQKNSNTDISKVSLPEYQQTIFNKIEYNLSYIDDSDDLTTAVEPIQTFIGFNSDQEGVKYSQLLLWKKEDVEFSINSTDNSYVTFESIFEANDVYGLIKLNESSNEYFTGNGFKPGQRIVLYLKDLSNSKNQFTSPNNASLFKIREVYSKMIKVDFLSDLGILIPEKTIIQDYPTNGFKTYLRLTIRVLDREIGRFLCYGQTEDEDERFKIELGNIGKLISPEEVFIFKEYDILEGGIDWMVLNRKRKEMLMMKHLIYPYIGSYKAIINAINYFGYNDLVLNEYFRDIDPDSPNFTKTYKVQIPDVFDNTIEGWTENEYIKNTFPNDKYEETNTFNLSYFITDKEGNITLNYTLDEIIIKLQGLKYWLKKNVIPLTHKILDITGQAYTNNTYGITHKNVDTRIINMKEEMCPITFKLNEAYLMPVNSGSTVYNCVLDFYSIIPGVGASQSIGTELIRPYNGATLILPDYFDIKIRTFKTYKEWAPFVTYNTGDKITYFGKLYESQIDNNRVKNPRRFDETLEWQLNTTYEVSSIVKYNRDVFVYSGLGNTQSVTSPNLDTLNWLKITEWKLIDLEPVQTITEWRKGTDLLPFNFTIDSNIDPFLVIEVTSDNGYGQVYTHRLNYEIRGLKDLQESYEYIDPIGPFNPIEPVY